ncbi:MAG: hypothetical protein BMS9Abin07_2389 [Acidimicrobiia bacterium]|nr:MAG: hypothetical protein BMS9Abin07_2389 [Acidimicrobiia bacterium]
MLSWSALDTGVAWDPRSVTDPTVDPLIAGGRALVTFVDAAHGSDDVALASARTALCDSLGDAATVDAAGVIGNFNQMNRLADAAGVPVGPGFFNRTAELRAATGIARFYAHTP